MQFYKYNTKRTSQDEYKYTIKLVKDTEERQLDGSYVATEIVREGFCETRERAQIRAIRTIKKLEGDNNK